MKNKTESSIAISKNTCHRPAANSIIDMVTKFNKRVADTRFKPVSFVEVMLNGNNYTVVFKAYNKSISNSTMSSLQWSGSFGFGQIGSCCGSYLLYSHRINIPDKPIHAELLDLVFDCTEKIANTRDYTSVMYITAGYQNVLY